MGVGIGNAVGTYAATAPEKSIAKSSKKFTRKNGTTPHKPHLLTHGTKEWRNQQYHVVLVGRSVGLPAAKRWGGVWSSHHHGDNDVCSGSKNGEQPPHRRFWWCEKPITYAHPLSLDYMCITSSSGESGGTGYDLGLIYI